MTTVLPDGFSRSRSGRGLPMTPAISQTAGAMAAAGPSATLQQGIEDELQGTVRFITRSRGCGLLSTFSRAASRCVAHTLRRCLKAKALTELLVFRRE